VRIPSVSVVLPTRDRPTFLLQAVDSVLAQQAPAAELLLVDDGHEGAAEAVANRLGGRPGPAIRVLPGPRRGPGAARNVGIQAACGELIAFLDDDDLWLPEKLAWQVAWFVSRPTLGALGTEFARAENPNAFTRHPPRRPGRLRRVSRGALLRGNRLATSSVVVRRRCFEECGGFDESLPLAQDWEMWLRIAARWEVSVVAAPLAIYRLHGAQRSRSQAEMRTWEAEVLRRELSRGNLGGAWLRGAARRRLAWAHYRLGLLLAREGEAERAIEELRRAMALFPYQPLIWSNLARCALARRAPARLPAGGQAGARQL